MRSRLAAVHETRERILEAAFRLWCEHPYDDVTLDRVAQTANVTRQTVHRQFGSKDDLAMAVTGWAGPRIEQAATSTPPGDVEAGIRQQFEQYEQMGDLNVRMVQMEGRVPAFDHALQQGRIAHRRWIEHVFGPHLPRPGRAREMAIMAIYAATDVMVWKLLRRDFDMPRADAQGTMLRLVRGVMEEQRGRGSN